MAGPDAPTDSAAACAAFADGTRVLVVDDAPGVHDLLEVGLGVAGFQVLSATNGPDALSMFLDKRPDAVLLDVLMPGMDGYELCRRLRELTDTPIIMLSALRNETDIIKGLDAGADDYVTKPFSVAELTARIRAQLRRQRRADAPQRRLAFAPGRLEIDLDSRLVSRDGEPVRLSPTEFRLLAYLAVNTGRVVPHRELIEQVWGPDSAHLGRYLKIYVRRLRQKVEPPDADAPQYIASRHGMGYTFQGTALHTT